MKRIYFEPDIAGNWFVYVNQQPLRTVVDRYNLLSYRRRHRLSYGSWPVACEGIAWSSNFLIRPIIGQDMSCVSIEAWLKAAYIGITINFWHKRQRRCRPTNNALDFPRFWFEFNNGHTIMRLLECLFEPCAPSARFSSWFLHFYP